MTLDIARARRETPGCENVIHFNNAGAALMPRPVLDATVQHLELEAHVGGYEAANEVRVSLEGVYDSVGRLLGCSREELAIIENATRAWDMAFYSIPFQPGDRILTSVAEYASNYIAFLQIAQRVGVEIEAIPNDEHGQLDLAAMRAAIDEQVKLIAISHVPTNGGLVNPAEGIGQIAREHGVAYLLDACQSVGQMPVDVERIGCDMLSATGRKFLRGPRGTGMLYVRRSLLERLEPPFLDLHAADWVHPDRYEIRKDARRFENWETNVAGKLGLGVAVEYASEWGLDAIWERVRGLASRLRECLAQLPGVEVRDLGVVKCGIVTFTVAGRTAAEIRDQMALAGINVSVSVRKYTRLDMTARDLDEVVRASVHYYNTEDEVGRFVDVLTGLL
jgi:selenocysteine lyase/cysteine desulfurase